MRSYFVCWLACFFLMVTQSHAQVHFSSAPLSGVPGVDYWVVNYVDHDTSAAMANYECGSKTYNGHTGTDFLLRSFKTMDSGIYVLAVENGRVFETVDTMFDRNKHTNADGFGNYVGINHQGQYYTYYAHLMKYSLLVAVGDSVVAGQRIGKVACSGNCTDPHVHLEVWDNTQNIDPFAGTCNVGPSLWTTTIPYDTSLRVIDAGFTPYVPNLDTLRERHLVTDTFYAHTDTVVNFWIQMQGLRAGDTDRVDWYSPSGTFWFSYAHGYAADGWYNYFWTYITMPDTVGTWTAKYYVNGALTATKPFYVVDTTRVTTALQPANSSNDLRLSPNPVSNALYIDGNLPAGIPLQIIDPTGRIIASYAPETRTIPCAFLAPGVYLLRCGNTIKRIVKE